MDKHTVEVDGVVFVTKTRHRFVIISGRKFGELDFATRRTPLLATVPKAYGYSDNADTAIRRARKAGIPGVVVVDLTTGAAAYGELDIR